MTPTPDTGQPRIRPARRADIPAVAALWCDAFPSTRTPEDRARMLEAGGRYGGLETVLVVEEGPRLVGACKLYRLTGHITGRPTPVMGLAAVAVDRDWRRRGIGARLCIAAARAARERGDTVSLLYPFRTDYYARLGWGQVGRLHEHVFLTRALPSYPEAGAVRQARLRQDLDAVAACYQRVVGRAHGPIRRDARVWAYRLLGEELAARALEDRAVDRVSGDASRIVIVHEQDGVDGYALLRLHRNGAGSNDLAVRELVAETNEAYRGLLGWIAARSQRWPRARYRARPEELFEDRLRDPRRPDHSPSSSLYFHTGRLMRGPMLRILDLPAALGSRAWFDGVGTAPRPGGLVLESKDTAIQENRGPWLVRIDDAGTAAVEAAAGGRATATVSTDPATLARLYAGDLTVTEAVRLGACDFAGDLAWADAAFAVRETFWLPDEF